MQLQTINRPFYGDFHSHLAAFQFTSVQTVDNVTLISFKNIFTRFLYCCSLVYLSISHQRTTFFRFCSFVWWCHVFFFLFLKVVLLSHKNMSSSLLLGCEGPKSYVEFFSDFLHYIMMSQAALIKKKQCSFVKAFNPPIITNMEGFSLKWTLDIRTPCSLLFLTANLTLTQSKTKI